MGGLVRDGVGYLINGNTELQAGDSVVVFCISGLIKKLDIGTIINKKMIAASHIYQMMLDTDVANVKCLTIANADVAEFIVNEGSIVTQGAVKNLRLPQGVTLGGLVRDGVGYLINGNTELQAGDSVVVFCISGLIKKLDRYFCKPTSSISRLMSALSN